MTLNETMGNPAAARIAVLGSLNMDVVLNLQRMPQCGETVHAQGLQYVPGGKGGNQALACARHGAQVVLFGCVGRDAHGNTLRTTLQQGGVEVGYVQVHDSVPTGTAVVMVEPDGSNRIAVVAGANAVAELPMPSFVAALTGAQYLVLQLESPLELLDRAIKVAHAAGCKVVLNPSPVQDLPAHWWPMLEMLVLNEHEAQQLSGIVVVDEDSALRAARHLQAQGVAQVVITLGAMGVVALDASGYCIHPAIKVEVVDTTSAGDTFLGTLLTRLGEGMALGTAVQWGIRAASLCVGRRGAQPSIPQRSEVESMMVAP